jgi:hypothetical protein
MTVVFIVIVVLVIILAVWQTIQLRALRAMVAAVPADGDVIGMLTRIDARITSSEAQLAQINQRVESVEARLPFALSYLGVVSYNAFGNIVGNRSRSVALLNQQEDGIVITLLAAREETLFFTKEVRSGSGVEELSPEEQSAVDRALGR